MCLKTLATMFLVIVNTGFFLGGGSMLAVGIIAFVDEDLLYQITDMLADTLSKVLDNIDILTQIDLAGLIITNAIIMCAVGGVLFVLGFLGCCGAWKKNATLLKAYGTVVTVILMGEIGLSVYAYMYADQFEKTLKDGLKLALFKAYKQGLREKTQQGYLDASQELQELSMDLLQMQLGCCGISNQTEWQQEGNVWNKTYSITFNHSVDTFTAQLPPSCCILSKEDAIQGNEFKGINVSDFEDLADCMNYQSSQYVHTTPCFNRLQTILKDNEDLVIIIFVVTMGIQLLAVVLACFLKPDK